MADLIELSQWEPGIYQLETDDPVLGGEDGIDNLQAKQLANRTKYLKEQVELRLTQPQVEALIAALVDSSPAALDTLNELAAALGDDPNFAATITNALALKAPLASPALTGNPTAPTQAPGTNNTSLANTEFVMAALAANLAILPGSVIYFARTTAPTGYLKANGAAVSRSTYAALFSVIGTTFGAGDGSTTFNLPDLRDRFAIGSDLAYALGATGGSKDAVVVSHTHTGSTDSKGSHSHTFPVLANQWGASTSNTTGGSGGQVGTVTTAADGLHSHSISVNAEGSSGINANLPPYVGLLACIKY